MKLNKEFIKQLRNGEIAVENNETIKQLRRVLKAAFPKYKINVIGGYRFYFMDVVCTNEWDCSEATTLPIISISEFYQPEPFTGWGKYDSHPKWMGYFKNDVAKFGFNSMGAWMKWGVNRCAYSEDPDIRPATNEEIETTLTKEAKRRGYKGGDTIKGIHGTSHIRHEIISFTYDPEDDRLLTNEGCIVYKKGQWAEIVEKPQPKKSTSLNYLVDGMLLRDYFAAKALSIIPFLAKEYYQNANTWDEQAIANESYKMADAMLQERNKTDSDE